MALSSQEVELLRETRDTVVKTEAHMKTCVKAIETLNKVVFGNSQPGLVSRVRMMWWILTTMIILLATFSAAMVTAWVKQ